MKEHLLQSSRGNLGEEKSVLVGCDQTRHVVFCNSAPLKVIAGPCSLESQSHALEMSFALKEISNQLGIGLVYKTSFDKANRTSALASRGLGFEASLPVFSEIREKTGLPIVTDVHVASQCNPVSEVVDMLQIPSLLCRQTDLLKAAASTYKPVHVKKGQFLAPWDMKSVISKLELFGCEKIILCERGVTFGYNMLVSDMRSLPILKESRYPVIFDVTHSVQCPGSEGSSSGGQRKFIPALARAAVSIGIAGIFLETHQNPDQAFSDGPSMIHLGDLPNLLGLLNEFDRLAKDRLPEIQLTGE